jgi:hypothetical protein
MLLRLAVTKQEAIKMDQSIHQARWILGPVFALGLLVTITGLLFS